MDLKSKRKTKKAAGGSKAATNNERHLELTTFRDALENSTDAIGMATPDGHHYFQNKAFIELFGDLIGKPIPTVFCDKRQCEDMLGTIKSGGKWNGEVKLFARDGRIATALLRAYANKDENGEILNLVGIFTDIGVLKELEGRLEKTIKDWKVTFDAVTDAIWILDKDQKIIRTNKAAVEIFGLQIDQMVGRHCWEIVHGTREPIPECPVTRMFLSKGRESMETELGGRWLEVTVDPVVDESGNILYAVHTVRDITHHKRAEQALRESESLLVQSQQIGHIGSWNLDLDTRRLSWSDETYRIFGLQKGTPLSYVSFLDLVHPEDRAAVDRAYTGSLDEGTGSYDIEHRIIRKDTCEIRILHERCIHERDSSGRVVRSVGMVQDITERKKLEEILGTERSQMLSILESLDALVYVSDPATYEILYVNKALRDIIGKDPVGKVCHREFQGRATPCEYCNNEAILRQAPSPLHWEHYNEHLNRYFKLIDRIIKWPDGRDVRFELAYDITDYRKAQEEVRESEERLAATLKSIGDGVITCSMDGTVSSLNFVAERLTGWTTEEASGQPIDEVFRIVNGHTLEPEESPVHRSIRDGIIVELTNHTILISRGGARYNVADSCSPIRGASGNVIGAVLVFRDVTEEYRQRENLRRERENFELASSSARVALWTWDLGANSLEWSGVVDDMLGYSDDEFPRTLQAWKDVIHPEDRTKVLELLNSHIQNGTEYRVVYRVVRKDGRLAWWRARGSAQRNEDGKALMHGACVDITDLKSMEEYLCESEQRFRGVYETAPLAFVLWDPTGCVTEWNDQAENLFGWRREEAVGRNFFDFLIPPSARMAVEDIVKNLSEGRMPSHIVNENLTKDGRTIICEWNNSILRDAAGKIIGFLSMALDITERKHMEESLRDSEAFLRQTQSLAHLGGWKTNPKTDSLEWSAGVYEIIEEPPDYRPGLKEGMKYYCPQYVAPLRKNLEDCLMTGEPFTMEAEIITAKGRKRWVEVRAFARKDTGEEQMVMGTIQDITGRKLAEETITRMRMLESLGTTAGGIAHDFNNLLMGVFGNIELAQESLPPLHPAMEWLKDAHDSLDIARRLTSRLLTFAKGGNPVLGSLDLRQGLCDTVRFHLAGSSVTPLFDIPDDLWPAKADKGQIAEVISNLTVNAKEAMPTGGTLRVQAVNMPNIKDPSAPDLHGDFVKLTFRDQGVGIPSSIVAKIFDPYFTTKQRGSGLGLSIVYGIIRKHGGHIGVESEPGAGTTFTVLLPAGTDASPDIHGHPPAAKPSETHKSCRILVMEDEEVPRKIASLMIQRLGHSVEAASDGTEAVEKFSEAIREGRPFDITIMDLTISGGIGGKEVVRKILDMDSSAKVIVASGYSSDPVLSDYTAYGFCGRLAKPFSLQELGKEISRVLNEK